MVEPGVGAHAAGAGHVPQAAERPRIVGAENRRASKAVVDDAVGKGQLGDLAEVDGDAAQRCGIWKLVQRYPAGSDRPAQQPMAGYGGIEAQKSFTYALRMTIGEP